MNAKEIKECIKEALTTLKYEMRHDIPRIGKVFMPATP
jgi:hypothetical protein